MAISKAAIVHRTMHYMGLDVSHSERLLIPNGMTVHEAAKAYGLSDKTIDVITGEASASLELLYRR